MVKICIVNAFSKRQQPQTLQMHRPHDEEGTVQRLCDIDFNAKVK